MPRHFFEELRRKNDNGDGMSFARVVEFADCMTEGNTRDLIPEPSKHLCMVAASTEEPELGSAAEVRSAKADYVF